MIPAEQASEQLHSPWKADWSGAARSLEQADRVLLTTHVNPDGDGIGSMLALAEALRAAGKDCRCALPSPTPQVFRFLFEDSNMQAWSEEQCSELEAWDPQLMVILDVSSIKRTGWVSSFASGRRLLVLDHHMSNDLDDEGVYCFPGCSSTGEVTAALLQEMKLPVTASMAQALYTSLFTDTGGFAFASTAPESLELAGRLVRAGARPERVNEEVCLNYPLSRFELLRLFLGSRVSHENGQLLEFALSREMYAKAEAEREESEGFANTGLGIKGCFMTLILSDVEDGVTKINLRCKAPYDVCAIARQMGGGGHRFAAGATIEEPLVQVRERVLALAQEQIRSLGGAA